LGLILSALHFKWRLFTTHLGVSSPSKWRDHTFIILSFSFLSSFYFSFPLCSCVHLLLFSFHLLSFPYMLFNFAPHSSSTPYNCVFSLFSRSEPLHLLNHVVKFLSSGNLLWVSHHIRLKIKNHKQNATHKNVQF